MTVSPRFYYPPDPAALHAGATNMTDLSTQTGQYCTMLKIISIIGIVLVQLSQPARALATNSATLAGQTKVVLPQNTAAKKVTNEALDAIKSILATHRCINKNSELLKLNLHAYPGVDFKADDWNLWAENNQYPNSKYWMQYHDRKQCLDVRQIDEFKLLAKNALSFRVIFFADDSAETVKFFYQLKNHETGWKLFKVESQRRTSW